MAEAALIGVSSADAAERVVDVDQVRRQVEDIRNSLAPLMQDPGPLGLSEVSIELGVSATGKVGFIVAGSELTVSAAITLTFARPEGG